jgi:hypothetical protein
MPPPEFIQARVPEVAKIIGKIWRMKKTSP